MIYTDDIRKKLDTILKAFEGYIDSQDYFDIVYSKKVGYLYVVVGTPEEAGLELLDTPEKMLDVLFNEIMNRTHVPDARTLTKWEEAESRRQLTAILEQIEDDGAAYLKFLDRYLKDYQERYAEADKSC